MNYNGRHRVWFNSLIVGEIAASTIELDCYRLPWILCLSRSCWNPVLLGTERLPCS
jgi:hypothetical protein